MGKQLRNVTIFIVLALPLAYWIVTNNANDAKKKIAAQNHEREAKERYDKGPYIESTKAISDREEISIVIFPSREGWEFFDRRCIVYRNNYFRTSNMTCLQGGVNDSAD